MSSLAVRFGDREILAGRPPRPPHDPDRPQAFLVESERSSTGEIVDVATLFLTNRECPFRCLMCDLWRGATADSVPVGAIPHQIDYALARLPAARQIKLYNSGNFFDPRAIPPDDHAAIASRVRDYERVVVENHPRLCGPDCTRFAERLGGRLEIALGLETVHPEVLPALNKHMTLDDFARAVERLLAASIAVRAFVLLRPPFLSEAEGLAWAVRSVEWAFARGVECCSVIPVRAGNGIMDRLEREGRFAPPRMASIERVLEEGIGLRRGRVFVDLWDLERFAECARCLAPRQERLRRMNLEQRTLPPIACGCSAAA